MDTKRFKSAQYKKKIQAVRSYKREVMRVPETAFGKFLNRIGFGTILRQILFFLFLAALTYLAYFADFLVIKESQISGADPASAEQISRVLNDYKKSFWFIFPQKNTLFFSPERFSRYLLARDFELASAKTSKKLWHHVSISVMTRIPAYVLQNKDRFFILSSDGSISRAAEQTDKDKLLTIVDNVDDNISFGEIIFEPKKYRFLSYISENFTKKTSLQIGNFEINGKSSNDLIVIAKDAAKFYFDSATDPEKYLNRTFSLLVSLTPDQQKRLAYIDLRYDPKAYICYKNDKCAQKVEQIPDAVQSQDSTKSQNSVKPFDAVKQQADKPVPVQNKKPQQ